MAVLQETSYELLYRWAQSRCTTHNHHILDARNTVSMTGLNGNENDFVLIVCLCLKSTFDKN